MAYQKVLYNLRLIDHLITILIILFNKFGTLKTVKLTSTVIPENPINPFILVDGLIFFVNNDDNVMIVDIIGKLK